MTTKIDLSDANFINGEPNCQFDDIYPCFTGDHNGLLFRLVEKIDGGEKWSFYNDTVDTIMKVRTVFKPESAVEGLRGAKVTTVKNPKTDKPETVVDIEVWPTRTAQCISGSPNGFEMDFQTEAAPAEDVEFENGNPTKKYDKIYKCFKNNGNGLLFRLVDERSNKWYFHNDTTSYAMVATVEFSDRDAVMAEGTTEEIGVPEDHPEGVTLRVTVPPTTTAAFITGTPSNYRMSFAADPVGNDAPEDPDSIEYNNEDGPDTSVIDPSNAKIYKCFKKNGNGLLFRIVDERRRVWAYYNDTENYVMTAIVKFPQDENFQPSVHTEVSEDPEDAGVTVVKMEIPPLTTLEFIEGNPKVFETAYSAIGSSGPKPEESPNFRNGTPDKSKIDYDQVTKVVKEHDSEDAILFRLYDTKTHKWAFYNDSTDVTVKARVKFNDGASIRKFPGVRVDSDPSGERSGFYYEIDVQPGETVEFIEGDAKTVDSKFTGTRTVQPKDNESAE